MNQFRMEIVETIILINKALMRIDFAGQLETSYDNSKEFNEVKCALEHSFNKALNLITTCYCDPEVLK